jgi:hypothetical protein
VPDRGLDEEKLETLAGWAAGLRCDERPEVAAAGRAIELLIEEVERLHVMLWDKQLYPDDAADGDPPPEEPSIEHTLRRRLSLRRRRHENPHA